MWKNDSWWGAESDIEKELTNFTFISSKFLEKEKDKLEVKNHTSAYIENLLYKKSSKNNAERLILLRTNVAGGGGAKVS